VEFGVQRELMDGLTTRASSTERRRRRTASSHVSQRLEESVRCLLITGVTPRWHHPGGDTRLKLFLLWLNLERPPNKRHEMEVVHGDATAGDIRVMLCRTAVRSCVRWSSEERWLCWRHSGHRAVRPTWPRSAGHSVRLELR